MLYINIIHIISYYSNEGRIIFYFLLFHKFYKLKRKWLLHEANIENPNPCSQGRIQELLQGGGLKSFFSFLGGWGLAVSTRLGKKMKTIDFTEPRGEGGGVESPLWIRLCLHQ